MAFLRGLSSVCDRQRVQSLDLASENSGKILLILV